MILLELDCDDFLKFQRVRLARLPERGLIGIRGPNEAGKTSLGEAITFALFGRTLKLKEDDRGQAIRWGAESARVRLVFRIGAGFKHELVREMDLSGGYSAVLRVDGREEPVAEGPRAVDAALAQLIGFDFDAFRYAFYLGQKEIELLLEGEGTGPVLERMVGVKDLEDARRRAEEERAELVERERELGMWLRLQKELFGRLEKEEAERRRIEEEAGAETGRAGELAETVRELEGRLEELRARKAVTRGAEELIDRVMLCALVKGAAVRVASREVLAQAREAEIEPAQEAVEEARELLHEYRMFRESLEELEELLRAESRALSDPDGEPKGDWAAPGESRAGQARARRRALEMRKGEDEAEIVALGVRRSRMAKIGLAIGAAGAGGAFLTGNPLLCLSLLAPLLGWLPMRALDGHREAIERRLAAAGAQFEALDAEIADLEERAALCDRLSVTEKQELVEGVERVGSPALSRLLGRMARRHPRFYGAPEAFLEGYGKVLEESFRTRQEAGRKVELEARKALGEVDAAKRRLETLFRSPAVPRVAARPPEEPRSEPPATLDRIFDMSERLARRVEEWARGEGALTLDRESLYALLQELDPDREKGWPDLEGMFRVLDGAEAPGLGRSDDPVPWAEKQIETLRELLPEPGEEEASLREELEAARAEEEKHRVRAELLTERAAQLAEGKEDEEDPAQVIADLETRLAEAGHDAAVRGTLADLLQATAQRVRTRLFPAVAGYAARLLPRITGGRHGEVKVEEDGRLLVYAPEAGEYVPIEMLSGGARDQLLLALRLAFASAVVTSRVGAEGAPFLFLDEPLASSDEERGLAFLKVLEDRAEAFAQVFVVTHRLAGDESYDAILRLEEGSEVLEFPAA